MTACTTPIRLCQGCKQPIAPTVPHEACQAPNGETWYLHVWIGDCVRALLAANKRRRAA